MSLESELLRIEDHFWTGGPEAYRKYADEQCLVAFSELAGVMSRDDIAKSAERGRWTDVSLERKGVAELSDAGCAAHARRQAEPLRARAAKGLSRSSVFTRLPLERSTTIAESDRATWPRLDEFERDELSNTLKITLVIGHEHTSSLAAGQCKEDIVRERLRDARDFQTLLASHFRKEVTGLLPGVCRWRNRPIGSLEHLDNILLQRPAVF